MIDRYLSNFVNKKILINGGLGFIGSNLAIKLFYDFLYNLRRNYRTEKGYEAYMEKYIFDIREKDFLEWRKTFWIWQKPLSGTIPTFYL